MMCNSLGGTIPNLSALTNLQSLRLEDNDITGYIPTWLASLPSLQELIFSSNNLIGPIPPALLKNTNLTFQDSGNPQLCTGTNGCPPSMPPTSQSNGDHHKKNKKLLIIIGCIFGGLFIVIIIVLLLSWRILRSRRKYQELWRKLTIFCPQQIFPQPKVDIGLQRPDGQQIPGYKFDEVSCMTNNFANLLGSGASSKVYRGTLADRVTEVAVKRANPGSSANLYQQFHTEMDNLSRVDHENVVSLLGYCQESGEKILILEYMPNGTVEHKLFGSPEAWEILMSWNTRLKIALNAAKGLEYLHEGGVHPIFHRDVNTSNILLSEDMVAKVADLGLSKLLTEAGSSHVFTRATGTLGYLDPHYLQTHQLRNKTDVYSFGIMLPELICGVPSRSQCGGIGNWAKSHKQQHGTIDGIIDNALHDEYIESIQMVAEIALSSIAESPANRPTMSRVVEHLQRAIEIERNHGTGVSGTHYSNALSSMSDPYSSA